MDLLANRRRRPRNMMKKLKALKSQNFKSFRKGGIDEVGRGIREISISTFDEPNSMLGTGNGSGNSTQRMQRLFPGVYIK
jgi:hypothetical protein